MRFPSKKKAMAGAVLLSGAAVAAVLGMAGVLPWALSLQLAVLGALGIAVASAVVLVRRVDRRARHVHRAVEELGTTVGREHAGVSDRAKQARHRGRECYSAGRIEEALEEITPYAALDEATEKMRRRILNERRALGPLTGLPERTAPAYIPVPGRVLHLVTNALPNTQAGYTVRTHRIVTAQREAGLDPYVVTFPGWPDEKEGDTDPVREVDGIAYHRIRPGEYFPPGLQPQIDIAVEEVAELVERLRPAVLHAASNYRNATVALHVGRALGVPVVYELRGFLEETWLSNPGPLTRRGSERHRLLVERESSAMRQADAVVTLARTMQEEIVDRGVDPEQVVLAPNAVDSSLLESSRPDGSGYRDELGIAPEEFVIGSVSSLTHYEGFEVLIDAAALLREWGKNVRVLLVGDGKARPDLLERASSLGLEEVCVLPGRVGPDEALRAQAALDVLVCPRVDARVTRLVTPLKPVEAMALGTPVVASDLPALRELLVDGRAGTLVPPGDASALAEAVTRLEEDEELRERQVKEAREEVLSRRTWSRNAQVYRELYEGLGAFSSPENESPV